MSQMKLLRLKHFKLLYKISDWSKINRGFQSSIMTCESVDYDEYVPGKHCNLAQLIKEDVCNIFKIDRSPPSFPNL